MSKIYPNLTTVSAEDFISAILPTDGLIVAVTENYALPGVDFDTSSQAGIVKALHDRAANRLVVVALRDPYELASLPPVQTYVCTFSFRPASARAAADVLSGAAPSAGSTPVGVPGTELKAHDLP
jgi:beta-N-acetylhexosaminidase